MGTFTQNGKPLTLDLVATADAAWAIRRPAPVKPMAANVLPVFEVIQ